MKYRIEVLHGVNLNKLGSRPAEHYGAMTLAELEYKIGEFADELGLEVTFFQTNSEGDFVDRLHRASEVADAVIMNPGAWTHYSYAIRDALEITGLPAIEVHLSDVENREPWRRYSVITELCAGRVSGKGVAGYREALCLLRDELQSRKAGD